jgi:hypothetical protein
MSRILRLDIGAAPDSQARCKTAFREQLSAITLRGYEAALHSPAGSHTGTMSGDELSRRMPPATALDTQAASSTATKTYRLSLLMIRPEALLLFPSVFYLPAEIQSANSSLIRAAPAAATHGVHRCNSAAGPPRLRRRTPRRPTSRTKESFAGFGQACMARG